MIAAKVRGGKRTRMDEEEEDATDKWLWAVTSSAGVDPKAVYAVICAFRDKLQRPLKSLVLVPDAEAFMEALRLAQLDRRPKKEHGVTLPATTWDCLTLTTSTIATLLEEVWTLYMQPAFAKSPPTRDAVLKNGETRAYWINLALAKNDLDTSRRRSHGRGLMQDFVQRKEFTSLVRATRAKLVKVFGGHAK